MTSAGCSNSCARALDRKAKSPGAHFNICLPLADIKRLSEDFVSAKYERFNAESNVNDLDTTKISCQEMLIHLTF
ncbi:hypothetical protein MCEMRE26_00195 [Candidatus Nanopelagicaceae bacterium]